MEIPISQLNPIQPNSPVQPDNPVKRVRKNSPVTPAGKTGINTPVKVSISELFSGVRSNNYEAVKRQIKAGVNVNARDNNGQTALIGAASGGHTEIVRALIQGGADVNAADNKHRKVLQYYAKNKPAVSKLLKAAGAIEYRKPSVQKLIKAAENNNHQEIKNQIASSVNLNGKDKLGNTALHWAAWKGYTEIVKTLIEAGADVNAVNNLRYTALYHAAEGYYGAAEEGYTEIVKALIAAKADVNVRNKFGWTALRRAVSSKRKKIARLLKAAGARI